MGYTVSLTTPSMPNAVARYAVVTPVRDEEEYLESDDRVGHRADASTDRVGDRR